MHTFFSAIVGLHSFHADWLGVGWPFVNMFSPRPKLCWSYRYADDRFANNQTDRADKTEMHSRNQAR